jgi:hypothetical protein
LIVVDPFSVAHFVGFEVKIGANPGFRASRYTLGYNPPPASAGSGIYVDTFGRRIVGHRAPQEATLNAPLEVTLI